MKSTITAAWLLLLLFPGPDGLAQQKPVVKKTYCNPLIIGQSPTKRLSLSYEIQPVFHGTTNFPYSPLPVEYTTNIQTTQSLRLGYTKTLFAKPKLYMSFNAGYWFSTFNISNPENNSFARLLSQRQFHSITAGTNIFKPLNAKNFLLLNVSLEANGNGESLQNLSGDNLLAGGAVIYGWKKGFKRMWGIGVFRGYRLGKVIHVPALLYNNSFNKKWGVDALLPARANFRYTKSPKTMWTFGYELDGTQFAIRSSNSFYNNTFFQRGEIRPKLGLEKKLSKVWTFTATAGLRVNGRFDITDDYAGNKPIVQTELRPTVFINAGFHITDFKKKKK
ncbi:MAG: DUF6268 family outer membrane beta-barrel protein [Bacteroidota bacterium]|nr:DUF6268 family outer membrane beta-barrel protein [Bacteroidota bacterium]